VRRGVDLSREVRIRFPSTGTTVPFRHRFQ
jgi:hypothetical protein